MTRRKDLLELLSFNNAVNNNNGLLSDSQPQTGLFSNLLSNPNFLIGAEIAGQGLQGKDPFSSVLPAVTKTAQIRKLLTPKDTRPPLQKLAESMGLRPGTDQYNKFINAGTAKTEAGLNSINLKNLNVANKLKTNFGILSKQIPDLIKRVQNSQTGLAGATVSGFDVLGDQSKQFANIIKVDKKFSEEANKEIISYLKEKGITSKAQNYASIKSSVNNLAYILASIAEPGNPKFSEGDIKRQLDRINWGGSRNQITAGLTQILKDEYISAQTKFTNLAPNKDFGYDINEILGGSSSVINSDKKKKKEGNQEGYDPLGILK